MSVKIKFTPSDVTKFSVICAMDEKMGIGKDGSIPWDILEDRQFFHETTVNNIVIMGRKTWETLPNKHLPNRLNIIISKKARKYDDEIVQQRIKENYDPSINNIDFNWFEHDLESGLQLAYLMNVNRENRYKIYVIGGQSIFEKAIQHIHCQELILTVIKGNYQCNTFFPKFDWNDWDYSFCPIFPYINLGMKASIYQFTKKTYFERNLIKNIPDVE